MDHRQFRNAILASISTSKPNRRPPVQTYRKRLPDSFPPFLSRVQGVQGQRNAISKDTSRDRNRDRLDGDVTVQPWGAQPSNASVMDIVVRVELVSQVNVRCYRCCGCFCCGCALNHSNLVSVFCLFVIRIFRSRSKTNTCLIWYVKSISGCSF